MLKKAPVTSIALDTTFPDLIQYNSAGFAVPRNEYRCFCLICGRPLKTFDSISLIYSAENESLR